MRIVDLTMIIEEGMQTYNAYWHTFTEITQLGRHGIENRETRTVKIGTHTGTHIDAPRHFIKDGATVDQIDLVQLCGKAAVLDFSYLPDFHEVSLHELEIELVSKSAERIIVRFDWDKKALGTARYYTDHPYFSEEACLYLVKSGCKLLAMDIPQPDNPLNGYGADKDSPNHLILLENYVILVEYLVNVSEIISQEVMLYVAPLKIKDGDGAPARCFVVEDKICL